MSVSTYKRYKNIDVLKIEKRTRDKNQMVDVIRQTAHPKMMLGLLNEVFHFVESRYTYLVNEVWDMDNMKNFSLKKMKQKK